MCTTTMTCFWLARCPNLVSLQTFRVWSAMSEKPNDQVRACLAHADECARKAEKAASNEIRDDYLRLQGYWLNLADSYESADRVLNSTNEHDRERRAFLKGKQ
jgi:hypothetical protein